jgi:hypothetical protein
MRYCRASFEHFLHVGDYIGRFLDDSPSVSFTGHSCRKQFSTRQILNAKAPEPDSLSQLEPQGIGRTTLTN